MNDKTLAVLKGWLALNSFEREQLLTEIQKNQELVKKGNISLEEDVKVRPLNFGPRGEPCPCCNR